MSRDADVEYRGTFNIEQVLAAFDRIDERAEQSAQKIARLSSAAEARQARGGVSDEQVALARRAREVARAREAEARATKAEVESEIRQRREAARVAQQISRDEEREAKRAAAEEARAFKAMVDAENRQRREAAQIAAQLRRDEERDLREFGNRQRRQTRELIEERRRAEQESIIQLGSQSTGDRILGQVFSANVLSNGLFRAIDDARAALDALIARFEAFVSRGVSFNQTLETSRRSIGALIATYYEFRDAQGNVLQGNAAVDAAFAQSSKIIEQLRVEAARTPLSFEELLGALQQVVANAGSAKVRIEQLVPLTTELAGAVKVLGLDSKQVNQEIRALLTGDVGPDASLARALQINQKMVDKWREQGTLVEELNKRLLYFNLASARAAKDLDVLVSNLGDTYDLLAQQATEKTFDRIKELVARLSEGILDTANARLRPEIQAIVDFIDDALVRLIDRGLALEAGLLDGLRAFGSGLEANHDQLLDILDLSVDLLEELLLLVKSIDDMNSALIGFNSTGNDSVSILEAIRTLLRGFVLELTLLRDVFDNIRNLMTLIRVAIVGAFIEPIRTALSLVDKLVSKLGYVVPLLATLNRIAAEQGSAGLDAATGLGFGATRNAVARFGQRDGERTGEATKLPPDYEATAQAGLAGGKGGAARRARQQVDEAARLLDRIQDRLDDYGERTDEIASRRAGYDLEEARTLKEQSDLLEQIDDWYKKLAEKGKANTLALAERTRLEAQVNNLVAARLTALRENARLDQYQTYRREALGAGAIPLPLDGAARSSERPPLIGAARDAELLRIKQAEITKEVTLQFDQLDAAHRAEIERLRTSQLLRSEAERQRKEQEAIAKALTDQLDTQRDQVLEALNIREIASGSGGGVAPIVEQLSGVYEQLKQQFGEGSLDQIRQLQQLSELMLRTGIQAQDVGNAFGFVSQNLDTFAAQVQALAQIQSGDVAGGITTGLKAITKEALFSQQAFISFGQAAGNAILGLLNGTETAGSALKKFFFGLLGDLAIQFGSFLIAVGVGLASVSVLFGFSGGAAIAAGITLIALGTVLKGLAAASGSAPGGAATGGGASAPGGSNVADFQAARERRTRREQFNTSGEATGQRPLSFIPGAGGSGEAAVRIENEITVVTDEGTIVKKVVSAASRGTVRNALRRKTA